MVDRMKQILLAMALCFIGLPWSAALAQEGSLILPDSPGDAVGFVLSDPAADHHAPDILRVFVGSSEACCADKTPIAGAYSRDGGVVRFAPAFDFITGQAYTVETNGDATDLTSFTLADDTGALPPQVVAIYPNGPQIPENTLRFYIEFSAPMMPHRAAEFITLVDANGDADTTAFMSFTQELWNTDRTRLTLLMDPGRIKRGVAQNVALGPALLEGNSYSIVVQDGWPSAKTGQSIARYEHPFLVSPALRTLPDTGLWRLQAPTMATRDPVTITFDRLFDQQLAQTAIRVRDADGWQVNGMISLSVENGTQIWRFVPDSAWTTRQIQIDVDAHLEDVAGNNFRDLLDHSVGTNIQDVEMQTTTIELLNND